MGVGSLVMAVVLVLVGSLKSTETLEAQEGMFRRVETLRDNQEDNEYYTILEIIPDNGETELSYLVGEQEPYADGDFSTENDFLNLTIEEQRELVDELAEKRILTKDETAKDEYPLYYRNTSFDDAIFSIERNEGLVEDGYTETEGSYLVPGTYTEAISSGGQALYTFTPNAEFEGKDIDLESSYAYLFKADGTKIYLVYDVGAGAYVETTVSEGSDDGEDTPGETEKTTDAAANTQVEGKAAVVNSPISTGETGRIGIPKDVSGNGSSEEEKDSQLILKQPIETQPEENVKPDEQPQSSKQPVIPVIGDVSDGLGIDGAGDVYSGYGYLAGYLYTKSVEEYTVANNELMKKHVFGMQLDDRANFNIDIKTVKVSELTQADIETADMFYIQDGDYGVEGVSADMSAAISRALIGRVAGAKVRIPCIFDYQIYETMSVTATNSYMYKLAIMMMSTEMTTTYEYIVDGTTGWEDNTTSEAWENVKSYLPKTVSNGGHYVNDNVYFVNDIDLVSPDFTVTFSSKEITEGFADVYNAIVYENNLDADRESMIADLINPAIVIQYLINYQADAGILYKSSIKVLELQPCKDFNWDTEAGKLSFIDKYAPQFVSNPDAVEIVCMTTSEFVGKNDNLNATYDMIYIGSNIGAFQREQVTLSGTGEIRYLRRWCNTDMRGMVYSHIGDETPGVMDQWGGVGLLNSDYYEPNNIYNGSVRNDSVKLRYPGNDITSHNMEDLLEFLMSGYPIVVADDFFVYDHTDYKISGNTVTGINGGNSYRVKADGKRKCITTNAASWQADNADKTTVRYGILDTSSYMYQFIKKATYKNSSMNWKGREYPNLVNESGATVEFMETYLNRQKLSLNVTKVPTRYSYTTQGKYEVLKDVRYLEREEDGKYYLVYEFSINNISELSGASDRYTCRLYIDDNFDGKFSKTQEEVSELTIVESATGATVAVNNLQANKAYTVTRQLPGDYVGCIQWELLVSENSNPYVQSTETGLTAVKSAKETINVLQIMSTNLSTTNNVTISLEEEIRKYVEGEATATAWGEALVNVPDFDINVQSINTADYIIMWETWARRPENVQKAATTPEAFFNEYEGIFDGGGTDMLMMGYTDCYNEIAHEKGVEAIMNFATSGRSVLFSHDMTAYRIDYRNYEKLDISFLNYKDSNNAWERQQYQQGLEKFYRWKNPGNDWDSGVWANYSIYLATHIREVSGMDMYGVTVDRYDELSTYANDGKDYTIYDTEAWNYLKSLGKDMAFKPNTDQKAVVGQTTGVTYIQLRGGLRFSDWRNVGNNNWQQTDYFPYVISAETYASGDDSPDNPIDGSWTGIYNNAYDSTVISKVNDGVITSYPYEIPEKFVAATTHSQYYAVDLEADDDLDGESDLVVWYCVASRKSDDDYNSKYIDLYNVSPNDVRNNYYIYNKGNIIYTGMGHGLVDKQVEEIKLFINTMVAAYRAGVKTPDVSIVQSGEEGANKVDFIALPYDAAIVDGAGNLETVNNLNLKKTDVYFTVNDNNIIKGTKQIISEFYLDGTEVAFENAPLVDCETGAAVTAYIENDGKKYYSLESGKTYRVTFDLTAEQIAKSCKIEIKVYSRVVKTNAVNVSEKATDTVRVSKADMFDLD